MIDFGIYAGQFRYMTRSVHGQDRFIDIFCSRTLLHYVRLMACAVRLSSDFDVFNVRMPCLEGWTFWQYFCTVFKPSLWEGFSGIVTTQIISVSDWFHVVLSWGNVARQCRVYCSFDIDSDHYRVIATLKLKIKSTGPHQTACFIPDLSALSNPAVRKRERQ